MEIEEQKNIIRDMIQQEDNLLNHRLSWMLALQGLLITAFSVFWGKVPPASWLIVGFGFISSLSFWYSLYISHKAIEDLKKRCQEKRVTGDGKDWPPLQSVEDCKTILMPWRLLPPLVSVMWVAFGLIITLEC